MKKILIGIFGVIFILVFIFFITDLKTKKNYNMIIEIKKGESVSKSLENLGIKKSISFKIYLKVFKNGGRKIKAGYYSLNGSFSKTGIIKLLEEGKSLTTKYVIPEGYPYKNILKMLSSGDKKAEQEYEEALKKIAETFPYPTPNGNFEGYFYPETYYIEKTFSKEATLRVFLNEFLKRFPPAEYPDKEKFYKKLILASIIERESKVKEEKPIMASVFYNRIAKNMPLAADATVNYIFDYSKKRIYYKDLEVDSPYNTYKYKGLPPAPISNPDEDSIKATFYPAKTDYLFFVTKQDGTGEHFFSRTYTEHQKYISEKSRRVDN
ncbi:MAG: endolytic transglycosylase MltG [Fusobacteriaceae bacterium]